MTGISDLQKRLLPLLQLLEEWDSVIAAVPHDFSLVTAPIQAFRTVLEHFQRSQAITNLQLGDSATSALDRMHRTCAALRSDVIQVWPSGSPDWESFKSQGRDITKIGLFLKPQAATLCAAIIADNRGRIRFSENVTAELQELTEDALRHYRQQEKELEDKLGSSPEYRFVKVLFEIVSSLERLSAIVLRHRPRHPDLEADTVTLTFLANNFSGITDAEILSPVIACWQNLIDDNIPAIEAQGANITAIRKLISSSRLLRTTVVSHILSCLYRSPRVCTSQLVLENCNEMILDLHRDLQDQSTTELLPDKDVLTTCSVICQRAKNELTIRSPDDSVPQPHFLLSTWDEYSSQHKEDALRLLNEAKILFGTNMQMAYRNLRRSHTTKVKRLVDLADMLNEELDLDTESATVLTEGSLRTSETILNELSQRSLR